MSDSSHSRTPSGTTLNSDLPPLPCIRNELVLSLDNYFVHCSTLSLISINLVMALSTLLIFILQSRNILEASEELEMIITVFEAFSIFFTSLFVTEVFFRVALIGSYLPRDHLVTLDAIVVVTTLALQVYYCILKDKTLVMAASALLFFRWPRIVTRAAFPQRSCRPEPGKDYGEKAPTSPNERLQATLVSLRKLERERDDMVLILNQQALQIKELTADLEKHRIKSNQANRHSTSASTVLFVNPE